ncbi:MAG: D-2-hydroxyacid dehydrogenase family protein [Hyphomonadaceae bacterium]|nr:D-2-hydroxyacid dehydrogenase family protein [Hyphomonadaceae bacterium]
MAAIAILDDYQNAALRMADWSRLQTNNRIVTFTERLPDVEAAARALAEFEVIGIMRERTPFSRALFERLPKLRLLVTTGKRNAAIDLNAAKARNVLVCNTGGAGRATADLAFALMLGLARHLREEFNAMRPGGGWQTTLGFDLEGKTLGILGLGNLGARVGRIGTAFGMQVIAWSENLTDQRAEERGAERVDKDALFRRSDIVTIHSVLSPRTRGIVGARELGLMKPTALLINTSRGPIVDETALLAALREKRIAGFGADTFDVEPLPSDHPLRAEPRALLTPHLGYVTEETYRDFYGGMVQAIEAWLAGTPINVLS